MTTLVLIIAAVLLLVLVAMATRTLLQDKPQDQLPGAGLQPRIGSDTDI